MNIKCLLGFHKIELYEKMPERKLGDECYDTWIIRACTKCGHATIEVESYRYGDFEGTRGPYYDRFFTEIVRERMKNGYWPKK